MTGRAWAVGLVLAVVITSACDADDASPGPASTVMTGSLAPTRSSPEVAVTPVSTPASGAVSTRGSASPASTATTAAATVPPSTVPGTTTTLALGAADALQVVEIGRSVQGRPIVAVERGTVGGRVVLVIGVIHGDEPAGAGIVAELARAQLPAGLDLWLIESINPDGQAAGTRTTANEVDLDRNFPYDWQPLGEPGGPEYAGTGPASEPETRAVVDFISAIRPELGIWYHQDLFRINPASGRDGELRARYAELTGLPLLAVTGGTYTGVAATWQRRTIDGAVAFIVELGPTLSPAEAARHAAAVLDLGGR